MYMHILFDRQAYPEPQHLQMQKNKYGLAQQYGSSDLESAMMSGHLPRCLITWQAGNVGWSDVSVWIITDRRYLRTQNSETESISKPSPHWIHWHDGEPL